MRTRGKIGTVVIVLAIAAVGLWRACVAAPPEGPTTAERRSAAPAPRVEPVAATPPPEPGPEQSAPESVSPEETGVLVRGRVVDEEGRPLPGAEIGAAVLEQGIIPRDEKEILADEDGAFEVRVPAGVALRLEGRKEGFGTTRTVETTWEDEEPVEIVLKAASWLRGIVVDPDGKPVAGAWVMWTRLCRLGPSEPRGWIFTHKDRVNQVTGADGRFEVKVTPRTIRKLQVHARRKGFAPAGEVLEGRKLAFPGEIRLVLGATRPVELIVVDGATGRPVADARPTVFLLLEYTQHRCDTEATEPGRWTILGAAPDSELRLTVQATGYALKHETVSAGDGPFTIRLARRDVVRVSGRALDAQGRPVADAYVRAHEIDVKGRTHSAMAVSGPDGRFVFPDLNRGSRYRITAMLLRETERVAFPRDVVTDGDGTVDLEMVRPCRVRGRLGSTAPHFTIPVATLEVDRMRSLDGAERPAPLGGGQFDPGRGGRFVTGRFADGIYDFTLRPEGHLPVVLRDVRLEKGRSTDLGKIVCERANGLTVVVLDPAGRPVEGCRIVALGGPDVKRVSGRHPDEPGVLWISARLPDGEYRLFARGDDLALTLLGSVRLAGEVDRRVTYTLPVAGSLVVEVRDGAGRPVSGIVLDVRAALPTPLDRVLVNGLRNIPSTLWSRRDRSLPLWADLETKTDADGRLRLGPMAPGGYVIRLGAEEMSAEVLSGETTTVRLTR